MARGLGGVGPGEDGLVAREEALDLRLRPRARPRRVADRGELRVARLAVARREEDDVLEREREERGAALLEGRQAAAARGRLEPRVAEARVL